MQGEVTDNESHDTLRKSPKKVIEIRDLTTSFKNAAIWTPVIKGINLSVSSDETLAIVGESGSGKSITALSIMRLLPTISSRVEGEILFNGNSLLDLSEEEMRAIRGQRISMVFQEPMTSLNPVLTVGFQIAEALRYHQNLGRSECDDKAKELLKKVRIPDAGQRFSAYPHQLSGGMRQRVMIAMSLACRPSLLIADEPTTALDVTIQAQVLALLSELREEIGMALIFITHDMGVVAEIANRVAVMQSGKIVETGDVKQIFDDPQHSYTQKLIDLAPRLHSMRGTKGPIIFSDYSNNPAKSGAAMTSNSSRFGIPVSDPGGTEQAVEPPLLEIQGLVTRFDVRGGLLRKVKARVHAVENVSFSIAPGETLSLVGESGCGKSSVGRSILRLIQPASGEIRFEGKEILSLPQKAMQKVLRNIQMIFQDPYASLNPRQTVGAAIAEPMRVHNVGSREEIHNKVNSLLLSVGLEPDCILRYPHEFSGGQRQRICIARALGLNPKLLIADESVSALDVSTKANVLNLMMDLQIELGLSYLFISHDMAIVERVSHRVAVMYLGEIVEIGSRSDIFENCQHPYTKKLLSAVPIPDPFYRRPKLGGNDEIPSPIKRLGYKPIKKSYIEVAAGHYYQNPVP